MKANQKSIINFAYFTANFPSDFIKRCWGKDHWLFNHLTGKFLSQREKSGVVTMGGFMRFFMDLDRENQIKLMNWIDNNYLAFEDLK